MLILKQIEKGILGGGRIEEFSFYLYINNIMPKKQTFKESYERLTKISNLLDNEEVIDVDELIKLQSEAKKLYSFCDLKLKDLDKKLDTKIDD
ncbi:hypothetical protein HOG21_05290 [bacterium]|jgi:exonuclease VII small subunit|nr:hypothetical protein [bacterium]